MKHTAKALLMAGLVSLTGLVAGISSAQARVVVSPVIVTGGPAYVRPTPIYYAPAPVYVRPQPVYFGLAPYRYYRPVGYRYDRWDHRHGHGNWDNGHHRGHH